MNTPFKTYMDQALSEAKLAGNAGEVPVGAVIVQDGKVIARGQNRTRRDLDPSAHAEIVAIRAAAKTLDNFRLNNSDLYVTLEPCAMCAGAISEARIARVYFGADDPKSGGTTHGAKVFSHPQCHHKPEVYDGISARECAEILAEFFQKTR